jgi:hypothetical protein
MRIICKFKGIKDYIERNSRNKMQGDVDWIYLAQGRDRRRAIVSAVIKLRV